MTNSTVRRPAANKSARGIKALIMAASLAITLGGWGMLAAGQAANNAANAPAPAVQPAPASVRRSTQNQQLQSFVPAQQPLAVARTRSSR